MPERMPGDGQTTWSVKPSRRNDAVAILLAWGLSASLSLFVQPHGTPDHELLYYTFYNVTVAALVGFYLFDRLPEDGFALFAARAACAILLGTLVNESLVERFLFGTGPINGVGVYYGLTDSISWTAIFLLLRLAQRLNVVQRPGETAPEARSGTPPARAAEWLFVRATDGTRRIDARDVVYLEAERDFTRIVCANGEYFVSENLKSLLERSAEFGLIRVHKSFAVNVGRVERLTRTDVQLGGLRVPVGRRFRAAFVEGWRAHSTRPGAP